MVKNLSQLVRLGFWKIRVQSICSQAYLIKIKTEITITGLIKQDFLPLKLPYFYQFLIEF